MKQNVALLTQLLQDDRIGWELVVCDASDRTVRTLYSSQASRSIANYLLIWEDLFKFLLLTYLAVVS